MSSKFAMNVMQSDMKADEVILCCGNEEKHLYARPEGEWIIKPKENSQSAILICNKCNHFIPITIDNNFCPNCGAKMRRKGVQNGKLRTI